MVPVVELPPAAPSTCHVTEVSDAPETVAWNCVVAPGATVAEVGLIVTATAPLADETVMLATAEKTAPVFVHAFTTSLWPPPARFTEVVSEAEFDVYCATLSTYNRIAVITCPLGGAALACTDTGDATVAPAAGVHIRTVPAVVGGAHWA